MDRGEDPATTVRANASSASPAHRIFMSHSRRDAVEVDRVVTALERAGHDVWVDRADIVGGTEWQERIVRAIKDTDVFVIVLSPDSVASPEVRRELAIADRERKPVIPVVLRPVDVPDALEYSLVNVQRIDLSADFDLGVRRLTRAIGELSRGDPARGAMKVARASPGSAAGGRGRRWASARTAALAWATGGLLGALVSTLVDQVGGVSMVAVTTAITGVYGAVLGALFHRRLVEPVAVVLWPVLAMIPLVGILMGTAWLALGLTPTRPGAGIISLLGPVLGAALWAGLRVWLRRRELERLKASGHAVATRYVEVVKNPSWSVNGRHPFRIITEWRDPATHELRLFYSENLWFDPTRHVELSIITVFVDPHDPSSYYMDVSFLPKVR